MFPCMLLCVLITIFIKKLHLGCLSKLPEPHYFNDSQRIHINVEMFVLRFPYGLLEFRWLPFRSQTKPPLSVSQPVYH